ncbi:YgcG family protein [Weeksella sp. HMSC059D05]|uniref:TPM domain-containing protein n=1 Tax=Weeksella sp. HMSC059D05 TaxID=1715139 RepID=UPI000B231F10|nr:TPM domain-containing protein [Weeksella sp. HMSC059D05]
MKFLKTKFLSFLWVMLALFITQKTIAQQPFQQNNFITPQEVINSKTIPKRIVNDYGRIFDPMQLQALENKLVHFDDSTSTQIAIVTFRELKGYPIELLASEIGDKWGVGQKDKDNGIVVLISDLDRKVTIRTGYGAQIHIPPTIANNIIQKDMLPYFRNGDYYQGVDKGIDSMQRALKGKYKNEKTPENDQLGFWEIFFIFLIVIILLSIFSRGNNSGGNRTRRRRSLFDDVVIMNTGSTIFRGGGGSFGSGSGGGFGGFGGGSFGGGGASGSW